MNLIIGLFLLGPALLGGMILDCIANLFGDIAFAMSYPRFAGDLFIHSFLIILSLGLSWGYVRYRKSLLSAIRHNIPGLGPIVGHHLTELYFFLAWISLSLAFYLLSVLGREKIIETIDLRVIEAIGMLFVLWGFYSMVVLILSTFYGCFRIKGNQRGYYFIRISIMFVTLVLLSLILGQLFGSPWS